MGRSIPERYRPSVILLEENDINSETGMSPALSLLRDLDYDLYALPKRYFRIELCILGSGWAAHDFAARIAQCAIPDTGRPWRLSVRFRTGRLTGHFTGRAMSKLHEPGLERAKANLGDQDR